MGRAEEERSAPALEPDEKQRVQRANQIFLRLKKLLHDREDQFAERDISEATQAAQWLKEIVERHPDGWGRAYEDALAGSDLPEEDRADFGRRIEEAGGFEPFVRRDLERLRQGGDEAAEVSRQDLVCGVMAGLLAGGAIMGLPFYLSFVLGMSRKADCW